MYCTKCGSENSDDSKFCSNCGNNLQEPASGVFSGERAEPVYEKITDAEEVKPEAIPSYQEEIKINYGSEESAADKQNDSTGGNANVYSTASQTQYYSTDLNETKQGGGNIGFAIASLVCGILSLVCCCLSLFASSSAAWSSMDIPKIFAEREIIFINSSGVYISRRKCIPNLSRNGEDSIPALVVAPMRVKRLSGSLILLAIGPLPVTKSREKSSIAG